ncbi:MAG: hypothetical protein ACYCTE_13220 [Acidimicrobiales bacterium]
MSSDTPSLLDCRMRHRIEPARDHRPEQRTAVLVSFLATQRARSTEEPERGSDLFSGEARHAKETRASILDGWLGREHDASVARSQVV